MCLYLRAVYAERLCLVTFISAISFIVNFRISVISIPVILLKFTISVDVNGDLAGSAQIPLESSDDFFDDACLYWLKPMEHHSSF